MKKVFLSLLVLSSLTLSSCSDKAEDLKVADIDSECGCVESMNIVMKEMIGLLDGKKPADMSEEDMKAMEEKAKPLEKKIKEIEDHCEKKFPKLKLEDIKDCPAVEELKKTMKGMR
ncbi:MAG: hypothetical protein RL037_1879 [Bacteroidota bacterium]|jgi:hypothetical protein